MKPTDIDSIVIHCSATREGQDFNAKDIDRWHKERGFNGIGYHYVIKLDGTIEKGRNELSNGAHCSDKGLSGKSYNSHSIGICYIGGCDKNGNAKDTRTQAQKKAMSKLIKQLLDKYPTIKDILGHRDASPDKNHDGKITKNEWIKQCPSFEVRAEYPISVCIGKK